MGPSHEDFYPTVAIVALMKILRDPSLGVHHTAVVQAVMFILKTLGSPKCIQYLGQVMPPLLNMMRSCPVGMVEFFFQQLGLLVGLVKEHIKNYILDIFSLIREFWKANIQLSILSLVEAVAMALEGELKIYLPNLLPDILQIFETDASERRLASTKTLNVLIVFDTNLEEYLHLVVPSLVRLFERPDVPSSIKRASLQTIGQLCKKLNVTDQASRIIHSLTRLLSGNVVNVGSNTTNPLSTSVGSSGTATPQLDLKMAAMDAICNLIYQMTNDFIIFVPMLNQVSEMVLFRWLYQLRIHLFSFQDYVQESHSASEV